MDSRDQTRRYRLIARKRDVRVRLFTRNGFDWTERYPLIRNAVAALRTSSATIDGEAVCCDEAGVAVFEKLHSRARDCEVFLYAVDLLELDGENWRLRSLEEPKARLARLLAKAPAGIQYSEHLAGDGEAIFVHACKLGLEGIVSKHRETRIDPAQARLGSKSRIRTRRACYVSGMSHSRGARPSHCCALFRRLRQARPQRSRARVVRPGRSELSNVGDRGRPTVRAGGTETADCSIGQARGEAQAGMTRAQT
jgi:ATP-dependent DNA ligase